MYPSHLFRIVQDPPTAPVSVIGSDHSRILPFCLSLSLFTITIIKLFCIYCITHHNSLYCTIIFPLPLNPPFYVQQQQQQPQQQQQQQQHTTNIIQYG